MGPCAGTNLRQEIEQRLGDRIAIRQDEKQIRFGQNWPGQNRARAQMERSPAGGRIAELSRASEWCDDERHRFLDHCSAINRLIKTPWPDDHELFNPELVQVDFFEHRKNGLRDRGFCRTIARNTGVWRL